MFWLAALFTLLAFTPAAQAEFLAPGHGQFAFPFQQDGRVKPITVWTYGGKAIDADATVLFIMHGLERAPKNYLKPWVALVGKRNVLLLAPEFDRELFPGSRSYNLGNLRARAGAANVPADNTYVGIEKIFDHVVHRAGLKSPGYHIYGHSAGAQFVHRLVLLLPKARFASAIAANAGWYSLPNFDQRFPFGLSDVGVSNDALAASLQRRMVILLGENDNDPEHPSLNRRERVMPQGPHRFARGKNFFAQGESAATKLKVKLRWRLETVPGVGHDNAGMVRAAGKFLSN